MGNFSESTGMQGMRTTYTDRGLRPDPSSPWMLVEGSGRLSSG